MKRRQTLLVLLEVCVCCKLLSKIIKVRHEPFSKSIFREYQREFQYERSTVDQIFLVKQILQKCWGYKVDLLQILVDFKQTHEGVDRSVLRKILSDLKVQECQLELLEWQLKSQVKLQSQLTKCFGIDSEIILCDLIEYINKDTHWISLKYLSTNHPR